MKYSVYVIMILLLIAGAAAEYGRMDDPRVKAMDDSAVSDEDIQEGDDSFARTNDSPEVRNEQERKEQERKESDLGEDNSSDKPLRYGEGRPFDSGLANERPVPTLYGEQPEDTGRPEVVPVGRSDDAGRPVDAGKPDVVGLERALLNVENEQARQRIESNIAKILETVADDAEIEVELVEEDGSAIVKTRETVKYLGFIKGKATTRYSVNAEGQISERAPWFRFLYAKSA